MSTLALPSGETTFWLVVLGLVVVLVLGVLALIGTLLYLVRSISQSIVQLREVAEAQAGQPLATEPSTAQGESAGHGARPATGSGDGAVPEPGPATGTGDARNGEPGRGTDAE